MELHVTVAMPGDEEEAVAQEIVSFDDIDKIGARVASATRRWLRTVQVSKMRQRTSVLITAQFTEHPKPVGHELRAPIDGAHTKQRRRRKAK